MSSRDKPQQQKGNNPELVPAVQNTLSRKAEADLRRHHLTLLMKNGIPAYSVVNEFLSVRTLHELTIGKTGEIVQKVQRAMNCHIRIWPNAGEIKRQAVRILAQPFNEGDKDIPAKMACVEKGYHLLEKYMHRVAGAEERSSYYMMKMDKYLEIYNQHDGKKRSNRQGH